MQLRFKNDHYRNREFGQTPGNVLPISWSVFLSVVSSSLFSLGRLAPVTLSTGQAELGTPETTRMMIQPQTCPCVALCFPQLQIPRGGTLAQPGSTACPQYNQLWPRVGEPFVSVSVCACLRTETARLTNMTVTGGVTRCPCFSASFYCDMLVDSI